MGKNPRSAVRFGALGFSLLLTLPLPGLGAKWDVQVKQVFTTRVVQEGGVTKAGGETTTFLEGEDVRIECLYLYKQVGDKKDFTSWMVHVSVDGFGVHSEPVNAYAGAVGSKFHTWKADHPGSRKIKCALEMFKDSDPSNNTAQITVTVKARRPLTTGEFPTPLPQNPPPGQKVALVPNLILALKAKVPKSPVGGWPNLFDYVIHRPYQSVKWHVDIARPSRAGTFSLATPPVGEFQGVVDNLSYEGFNAFLTRAWLDERGLGPGRYAALFYLSETANGKTTNGRKGVVEFELVEPLKAGSRPAGGVTVAGPPNPTPTKSVR